MRLYLASFCLLLASACGGSKAPTSPSATPPPVTTPSPAPAPTPTNAAPIVASLNFAPSFGIAGLTRFEFNGNATDVDGDPLTYTWDVAGNPFTGTSGSIVFTGASGGSGTARLTVSDGKTTATDTRTFTVGSMSGTWRGTFDRWNFTSNLQQDSLGRITGDYSDQLGPGRLDSAAANTINSSGAVSIRFKQATFSDFTMTGTMDSTGRRITGVTNGSGFVNTPFVMTKS
jgi:hypothetical protein